MKKFIIPIISIVILVLTIVFLNPITDKIASLVSREPDIIIKSANSYKKNIDYAFVKNTDNYTPYSYQDLLNIFYSIINNGWSEFTFYCPEEYKSCIKDIEDISDNETLLTHLNNYVHPFNSFTNSFASSKLSLLSFASAYSKDILLFVFSM